MKIRGKGDGRNGLAQQVWLIRHGETEWSVAKRHTGRTDIALTAAGEDQATALGRYLGGRPFALVLCSPLRRAWDTCRLAGYGGMAKRTDDLVEWDYGVYEGRTTSDIRQELPAWSIWTSPVPAGESIEQVGSRAKRILQLVLDADGNVVLFAHAHMLRILTACWLGLPLEAGRLFVLSTASVSVLGYERDTRVVIAWNKESHNDQIGIGVSGSSADPLPHHRTCGSASTGPKG